MMWILNKYRKSKHAAERRQAKAIEESGVAVVAHLLLHRHEEQLCGAIKT